MPSPILGSKVWNIRSFGAKGRGVVKAIENNIPAKYDGRRKGLNFMVNKHSGWLADVIDARDKINHFVDGGINFGFFTVYAVREGEGVKLRIPMWSKDQSMREFMKTVWGNLLQFTEGFTASSIFLRFQEPYVLLHSPQDIESTTSPWVVTTQDVMDATTKRGGWNTQDLSLKGTDG